MSQIDEIFADGRRASASDVHLIPDHPPMRRVHGELIPAGGEPFSADDVERFAHALMTDELYGRFDARGGLSFCYGSEIAGRLRISVTRHRDGLVITARVIAETVIPLNALGLPRVVASLTELKSGLVLVTGATGTGKSTTLASLVDRINETRFGTIVTIEDPIEFVHESKGSMVLQREIGTHVRSYSDGLRAALRQDPDVILVGELLDRESMQLALEACETGHLVFATLHTRSAVSTIDRILDSFPPDAHGQVRTTLADNLKCVICQELVRTADGGGRRPTTEILTNMPAVAQLIRDGETFKLPSVITTGRRHGMRLMDDSLLSLVRSGDIDADDARRIANDKSAFGPYVSRPVQGFKGKKSMSSASLR